MIVRPRIIRARSGCVVESPGVLSQFCVARRCAARVKGKRVKPQTVTRPDAIALLSPGNAEACDVVPVVRRVPVAIGGTGDVRPVVPGTATKDTVIAGIWAGWVVCGGLGVVFRAVPIRAPLPGISVHVVEPEGIGLELSHREP